MFSKLFNQKIKIKPGIIHTVYHFGNNSEIEDEELTLLEMNEQGDCLCLAPDNKGLVDVDYRDIVK